MAPPIGGAMPETREASIARRKGIPRPGGTINHTRGRTGRTVLLEGDGVSRGGQVGITGADAEVESAAR